MALRTTALTSISWARTKNEPSARAHTANATPPNRNMKISLVEFRTREKVDVRQVIRYDVANIRERIRIGKEISNACHYDCVPPTRQTAAGDFLAMDKSTKPVLLNHAEN